MFALVAAHWGAGVFANDDFADLFPSSRERPSIPATVMAAVIAPQAFDYSDRDTAEAVSCDLRRKAALGWPPTMRG
jgi:hypothetical protein